MIVVAGVLLIQDSHYVLQHRDNKPTIAEPDTYSLWGGTVNEQELPLDGAVRELREETGVHVAPAELTPLYDYETTGKGPDSFGLPVHAHVFTYQLDSVQPVECLEGKGIIRLPVGGPLHEKLNDFAREAIELYEASPR